MTSPETRSLDLLDTSASDSGGCGCGGCGCGSGAADTTETESKEISMTDQTTQTFAVTGMTCHHCVGSVTEELTALDGVTEVNVDLVPGGTSIVTVISVTPLADAQVAAALDEAGDYRIV